MPRKVKQKQKQKQKQSQTVIVNVGARRRARAKSGSRSVPPPQPPQFISYPVPALRGPEPMVTSQPSLAQILQALQPLRAPVIPPISIPPPVPVPAPIAQLVDESKQEVGQLRAVSPPNAYETPDFPLVYAAPSSSSSSSSSSYSSSAMSEDPSTWTEEDLNRLSVKSKSPGGSSLRQLALDYRVELGRDVTKGDIIRKLLDRFNSSAQAASAPSSPLAPRPSLIPIRKIKKPVFPPKE